MRVLWEPVSEVRDLAPDEVHVWCADLDVLSEATFDLALSPDERARGERFRFARDRRRFSISRGLLRHLLGRYAHVPPAALRFGYGHRGKPFLPGDDGLRFNVSHSGGLALLAFARDRELGVDVERERSVPEACDIARRYFSRREETALVSLPEGERTKAFFRCWTRKEAVVKAQGDGLAQPLDAFDVTLAPGEPARLLFVRGEALPRFWLEDVPPAPGFAGALAVGGRPARVVRRAWRESMEVSHGSRRFGRHDDLQGGPEPRGAVLDLAGGPGEPARLA
ncbi:MAG TPA: 4'-phosphopantetheinyl transferase superfamily protein [Vicinamibacteria bacterium]|nr:4'-phosphopantetheinyl transferase superfamily protein [Vicinamibacteria bacterium]